jgi:CubicO group peptidase (beta-lactamase class C family)
VSAAYRALAAAGLAAGLAALAWHRAAPAATAEPPATSPSQPASAPAAGAGAAPALPPPAVVHSYFEYSTPPPAPAAAALDPLLPPIADAKTVGIEPEAMTRLMLAARFFHSDAVVVLKDGHLVQDQRFGKRSAPIELMSVTKSVVGVAIGRLLYTGKLRSLDLPVATWYPQWRGGPKQAITLRQIMNHTSGLRAQPSAEEVYASSDLVRQALDADLAHPPGTHFFYNNKAVNLLAGIVEKVSGRKLDEYMRDEVFAPLGIAHFAWMRDPAGNPHVLAGLQLDALDLARIGQLMLDGGVYNGKRLLAADFVAESVRAAQPFSPTGGLLWWVIPEWSKLEIDQPLLETWRRGGAEAAFLAALAPLAGRQIERAEMFAALDRAFGRDRSLDAWVRNVPARDLPTPRVTAGPAVGFDGNGSLGQYLVVLPAARMVAVRQIRQDSHLSGADDFERFTDLVRALAPDAAPPAIQAPRP